MWYSYSMKYVYSIRRVDPYTVVCPRVWPGTPRYTHVPYDSRRCTYMEMWAEIVTLAALQPCVYCSVKMWSKI